MRQTAQVLRVVAPGYAEVKVRRTSACASAHKCGSCDHCSMMEHAPEIIVVAENPENALAGDTVTVETANSTVMSAAFILYILPFLLFFSGYLIGGALKLAEGISIGLGGVGFVIGLLCAVLLDRYRKHHSPVVFRIVGIRAS